ncbi:hypothetical protein DY000_02016194 [Brassica cretica]|uniref:Uncharacterized protein n=1 Tax=Brassica cretica TaxID=69181 RepID=A0ABQ7D3M0_BRACR|nr:hypothetical protein DY000_02016194 [Brassica cretica]
MISRSNWRISGFLHRLRAPISVPGPRVRTSGSQIKDLVAYDLFPGVPTPKSPILKKAQLISLKKGDHQQKSRFGNKTSAWPKGSTTQKLENPKAYNTKETPKGLKSSDKDQEAGGSSATGSEVFSVSVPMGIDGSPSKVGVGSPWNSASEVFTILYCFSAPSRSQLPSDG